MIDLIFIIANFICIRNNILWKPKKDTKKHNSQGVNTDKIITSEPHQQENTNTHSDTNNDSDSSHDIIELQEINNKKTHELRQVTVV